jgi:aspartyl/asparaginyl beta-hydroxylase (cupin superfamily)
MQTNNALTPQAVKSDTRKLVLRVFKIGIPLAIVAYFVPWLVLFYVICGLLDLRRNTALNWATVNRYFFGNGWFTWLLSPFNLLMDLITFRNKKIYQLQDLPADYQEEINNLLNAIKTRNVIGELTDKMQGKNRGMIFFKWYGKNIKNTVTVPEFHQDYRYVKTIGISMFNKQQSTSLHFGPLRVTLRVLYNINAIDSDNIYIEVGQHKNVWRDSRMFIFDDTLQHRSVNGSDEQRYCMFVDILRPSYCPALLQRILNVVRMISLRVNHVFYKNWDFIK